MFKAGDKVKCISDGSFPALLEGNIYTVARYINTEKLVYLKEIEREDENGFYAWRFELYKEKYKFKVGDKVRIINHKNCSRDISECNDCLNKVGIVSKISYDSGWMIVWAENGHGCSALVEEDLELIESKPKEFIITSYSMKEVIGRLESAGVCTEYIQEIKQKYNIK